MKHERKIEEWMKAVPNKSWVESPRVFNSQYQQLNTHSTTQTLVTLYYHSAPVIELSDCVVSY